MNVDTVFTIFDSRPLYFLSVKDEFYDYTDDFNYVSKKWNEICHELIPSPKYNELKDTIDDVIHVHHPKDKPVNSWKSTISVFTNNIITVYNKSAVIGGGIFYSKDEQKLYYTITSAGADYTPNSFDEFKEIFHTKLDDMIMLVQWYHREYDKICDQMTESLSKSQLNMLNEEMTILQNNYMTEFKLLMM